MTRAKRKRELVLEPLKLKVFSGCEPVRPVVPGIPCARCGREDVPLLSNLSIGRAHLTCESCAVEEFQEIEGYTSKEAAASARKRSVEIPLLFAEMAIFDHLKEKKLVSAHALPISDRVRFLADAHVTYVTALSRSERREIETIVEQDLIEERLRSLLRFIGMTGKGSSSTQVSLSFNRSHYERLLILSYLGNFMINGIFKERNHVYDEALSKLFSKARDVGLGRYAEDVDNTTLPSKEFSQHPDIRRYRREYDEEVFWDELVRRLADRDLRLEKGAAAVARLSQKQYEELIVFYEAPYVEEFDRHGVKRITINDDSLEEEGTVHD